MLISRQASFSRQLQVQTRRLHIREPRRGLPRRLLPYATGKQDPSTAADSQQVTISQALTVIGLSGTLAVGGAAFCGIDVFGLFRWRWQDIQLSLQLYSLLLLLDAVLLVPNYSIPTSLQQQQTAQQSPASDQQQQQRQQQQHEAYLDMSAVSASSAWSLDSWRLMLALLKEGLSKPQLQQLPLQVRAAVDVLMSWVHWLEETYIGRS
jgi:predicted metalloprotease